MKTFFSFFSPQAALSASKAEVIATTNNHLDSFFPFDPYRLPGKKKVESLTDPALLDESVLISGHIDGNFGYITKQGFDIETKNIAIRNAVGI